jgi:RNA polymerase sigma-70 factor (ECF subfamily)
MSETVNLIERCRQGDQDAARQLFDDYLERLLPVASRRIGQRLKSRVDPEDVIQSVFRTFFSRLTDGQFSIHDQNDLFRLLMRITVHKTLRQVAHHKAAKRDPNHEVAQTADSQEQLFQLLAAEPTPDTALLYLDELEQFLSGFQKDDRQILELLMQGYSTTEIAKQLNTYDRKIRRVLERIRNIASHEGLAI